MTAPIREFRLKILYARNGIGVYFTHLESMHTLIKALRRSGLPYAVTQGCHIRPKMSFGPPLPMGHSSTCEFVDLYLREEIDLVEARKRLQPQMPPGFSLIDLIPVSADEGTFSSENLVKYRLVLAPSANETAEAIMRFLSDPAKTFKGRRGDTITTFTLGATITHLSRHQLSDGEEIHIEFHQGKPGSPSASKILTAIQEELGEQCEKIVEMERVALLPLPKTT